MLYLFYPKIIQNAIKEPITLPPEGLEEPDQTAEICSESLPCDHDVDVEVEPPVPLQEEIIHLPDSISTDLSTTPSSTENCEKCIAKCKCIDTAKGQCQSFCIDGREWVISVPRVGYFCFKYFTCVLVRPVLYSCNKTFSFACTDYVEQIKELLFSITKEERESIRERYKGKIPEPLTNQFPDRASKETAIKRHVTRKQLRTELFHSGEYPKQIQLNQQS